MSFVEDEVSRKRMALSATRTSCSFLTTLLTTSSLVRISNAGALVAQLTPARTSAAAIPFMARFRVFMVTTPFPCLRDSVPGAIHRYAVGTRPAVARAVVPDHRAHDRALRRVFPLNGRFQRAPTASSTP